jgi:predicted esterase
MKPDRDAFAKGRLIVKAGKNHFDEDVAAGLRELGLDRKRDGLLYIPKGYEESTPSPIAVMLHGAGGDAEHGMSLLKHLADAANLILLAPMSRGQSWDIISYDQFGPDIAFINQALAETLERFNIDTSRIAIGGFSDGASYALSVGLTNGDLFSHIIAFSPGFFYTVGTNGKPRVFISHGTSDNVLPIDHCSRRITARLQKQQYDLIYQEFKGPHIIPSDISDNAMKWFLK